MYKAWILLPSEKNLQNYGYQFKGLIFIHLFWHCFVCVKVPISENFLFSYLNLNITLRTSVKKFFDLHKTRIFYEFYKSLKFYFIAVHPPRWWECRQAHNRATWHGLWRTFRNSRVYALTWPSVKYIRGRKKIVRFTGRKEKLSSK